MKERSTTLLSYSFLFLNLEPHYIKATNFILCLSQTSRYYLLFYYKLVCNWCLHMGMINCNGVIDVSLSYKHIVHSSIKTFGSTKIVFPCNFHDIGYIKFFIILLLRI